MFARRHDDDNGDGEGRAMDEPLLNKGDIEGGTQCQSSVINNDNEREVLDPSPPPPPPSLSQFINLGRPEFPMLFIALLLMLTNQFMQLVNPKLLGHAYDALVDPNLNPEDKISKINQSLTLVLILHGSGVIAGFGRSVLMGTAGERIVARLRNTLYSKILNQEIAFFDGNKTGDLVSRLGSDTTVVRQAISSSWAEVTIGLARLVASICLMFSISPRLASVTLGACLGIFCVCLPFGRAIGKLSSAYQEVLGEAQNYPTEAIGAMRTVKSFAAERKEFERYRSKIGVPQDFRFWWPSRRPRTTYSIGFWKTLLTSSFYNFIFGAGFGAMYVSLWYGFRLVNDGQMTLGELTAFQAYIILIGGSLAHTSSSISQLIEAKGASARIFELLHREPRISSNPSPSIPAYSGRVEDEQEWGNSNVQQPTTPIPTARIFELLHRDPMISSTASPSSPACSGGAEGEQERGDSTVPQPTIPIPTASSSSSSQSDKSLRQGAVHFQNVSFAYPSRPNLKVLNNFTLSIPANSTTAIVGSSGAGKTTIISLLQRFYDVSTGSIRIDNVDIRTMDLHQMRRRIGYVQQEPQLFGMSVRDNVAYGIMDRDELVGDEEIYEACRKANAYDFIMQWPEGLDTLVGERGVKLSGGQKQRLAIARSILIDPRILILDEATSALDAESEHLVQQAIDTASEGRTVLIIAHRLSTIKRANSIVVLEDHSIQDVGTHDELIKRCATYQNLIKRQSSMAE